ncbi:carboxypeptidase-like regulatory domain-containing protein, partial [Fulvivirga sp.]
MKKILPFCMLWLLGITVYGQQTVTGTVRDVQTDEPVIGATVLVKGTSNGTVTDVDGNYSIQTKGQSDVLVFSFIGYAALEEAVGSRSVVDVSMEVDITQLNEVVVTAFGIERDKKALGYAVTGVDSDDLSTVKQANVINSLAGRVPGVVITQSTGGLGSGSRVVIRGNNSLTGQNQPLYVVDGVPVDNSGFGSANRNDPNSQTPNTANYERV